MSLFSYLLNGLTFFSSESTKQKVGQMTLLPPEKAVKIDWNEVDSIVEDGYRNWSGAKHKQSEDVS
jgi:hypothetical protein